MFSVSPDTYSAIHQVARYLFALGGVLILLFAALWLISEAREWKDKLHALPAAGMIGEMVVISGNKELPAQTWFPLPREGVLGSIRSCDLVVPADGVKACHLDFCWRDGVGLLIQPRSGCEVQVNHTVLDCKSDPESAPMTHGSSLQIGSAVLRLHLFAALDHVSASRTAPDTEDVPSVPVDQVPFSGPELPAPDAYAPTPDAAFFVPNPEAYVVPAPVPVYMQPPEPPMQAIPQPVQTVPQPIQTVPQPVRPLPPFSGSPAYPPAALNQGATSGADAEHPVVSPPRPRRSDRWKEDWSE